jgi:hypothetical protein
MRSEKGFVSLIGMIVSLLIICGLMYYIVTTYFKSSAVVLSPQSSAGGQGQPAVNSNNYGAAADAARAKVDEINKQIEARDKQMEGLYDR